MTNGIANGRVLDYTNGGVATITSGSVVVIGALSGIAVTDIPVGSVGAVNLDGAFSLPSAGFNGAQGQRVYWDTAAKEVTGTASTTTVFLGCLYYACGAGDETCVVNLIGNDQPGQMPFTAQLVAAPTEADFNNLLTKLINAGFMARS